MFDDRFDGMPDPLWHPFTSVPPLGPREILSRAQGAYVFTESGHRVFDAISSWWCQSLGHCHPRLLQAFTDQAKKMDQVVVAPHTHRPVMEFGQKLLSVMGGTLGRLFFSDNGSTAVETSLKIALQYQKNRGSTKRRRFVSLERGYHGDTLGAVAVSHVGEFHDLLPFQTDVFRSTAPYCYRCPVGLTFPSCKIACLKSAEKFFEAHGEEVAALIVEPLVLGAAGMITYPLAYLEGIVRLAKKYGALVIFDEVFTGFGRLGSLFAFHQLDKNLWPDMVCLSKGITSGFLPFAVTAVSGEIYKTFEGGTEKTLFHGHTFTANPMSCQVALEVLKIFEEEKIIEKIQPLIALMGKQGERFLRSPNVGEVRHHGMVWAVELVGGKKTKAVPVPANGPGWRIAQRCWEAGLWIRPLHNHVYFVPPFCATAQDLSHSFDVLLSAIQKESSWHS